MVSIDVWLALDAISLTTKQKPYRVPVSLMSIRCIVMDIVLSLVYGLT